MNRLSLFLGVIAFLFADGAIAAASLSSTMERIDFTFERPVEIPAQLLILSEARDSTPKAQVVRDEVLGAIARQQLRHRGIHARTLTQSCPAFPKCRGARAEDLLAPKFIVEAEPRPNADGRAYDLAARVSVLTYRAAAARTYSPHAEFTRTLDLENETKETLSAKLAGFIRGAADDYVAAAKTSAPARRGPRDTRPLPYAGEFTWTERPPPVEPETTVVGAAAPVRHWEIGKLQIGVVAGTPAYVNAFAGLWGLGGWPLAVGVSGGYLGVQSRGIQGELGWLWDRTGDFQQMVGVSLVSLNDHATGSRLVDALGNTVVDRKLAVQEERTTSDTMRLFLGPVYTVNWGAWRAQTGVGFRLSEGAESAARVYFQLGYTPGWKF